jgi:hypothetical protein
MKNAGLLVVVGMIVGTAQSAGAQELSAGDRVRIAVQGICPVSGQKLGEHGIPLEVRVGKETVFLCCRGCLKGKINPKHWGTIHANFARAQGQCPVMNQPLPPNPKWTIVEGQIIYVCCPSCIKKITADPKTYLRKVEEFHSASLQDGHRRQ